MAKLTEQDLRKDISSKKFNTLYVIYGDEKYLVRKYTELLISAVCGKNASDFDMIRLNSDTPLEEIFAASDMLPVMADKKCVLVTDYNINALSDSDCKTLIEFCEDISPSTVLIFSMPTLNTEPEKKGADSKKSGKFKKFLAAAEKSGAVAEMKKMGDIALEKQISLWAEKNGAKLSGNNASKIISRIGTDMTALKNEIDKLSAYVNGGEITAETINLLCAKNTEANIFAIANSISRNDFNATYEQLGYVFSEKEKPEVILSVLSAAFVDMYRMRAAVESGRKIADVAADFNYGRREFVLKSANNNVKRYSTDALRRILDAILETDIQLKSTRSDSRTLIETLIAKLLLIVKEDGRV